MKKVEYEPTEVILKKINDLEKKKFKLAWLNWKKLLK